MLKYCTFIGIVLFLTTFILIRGLRYDKKQFKTFIEFKDKHDKYYQSFGEEEKRFEVFTQNLLNIEIFNNEKHSYKKGINRFTDLSETEFKKAILGCVRESELPTSFYKSKHYATEMPTSFGEIKQDVQTNYWNDSSTVVDWRKKGVITSIKDQGTCGSCWAVSVTENIESHAAISSGKLVQLSAQQIVSCTPSILSSVEADGCQGSFPELGLAHVKMFGLAADHQYPYKSGGTGQPGKCLIPDIFPGAASITGFDTITNNLNRTLNYLRSTGPLGVSLDASKWQHYAGGVFDGCSSVGDGDSIDINHAVQLVGYGTDDMGGDYWLIRNSWGNRWGEKGYIRLKRNNQMKCQSSASGRILCGSCGILSNPIFPISATTTQNSNLFTP